GQVIALSGDPLAPGRIPRLEPTAIADDEFAFALCEGLVALALAELRGGSVDALGRALRLAVLGCGDALLLRRGLYATTLVERNAARGAAQAPAALRALYASASAGTGSQWLTRDPIEAARRALTQSFLDLEAERAGTRRDVLGYVGSADALLAASHDGFGA